MDQGGSFTTPNSSMNGGTPGGIREQHGAEYNPNDRLARTGMSF